MVHIFTPGSVATMASTGLLFLTGFIFYWTSVRPGRKLRDRFITEAMGSPAEPGLPAHPSLFERFDAQDKVLSDMHLKIKGAGLLNGQGERLVYTVAEIKTDVAGLKVDVAALARR